MMGSWNRSAVTLAAVLALAGCGGGGGGSGGIDIAPPTGGTTVVPQAGIRQLQGTVQFESISTLPGGGLDYSNVTRKPARRVRFDLRDSSGKVIASGITDAQGGYSVQAPAGAVVTLGVYAALSGSDGNTTAEVLDNTAGNALLGGKTSPFTIGSNSVSRMDVLLLSGWKLDFLTNKPSVTGDRVAAPFAILDTIYQSQDKMLAAAPDLKFPLLAVLWSVKNTQSTTTSMATGQVGPTSFNMDDHGRPFIVLHGKADVDTDEYDGSVIAHEWGHFFQQTFSRSDSPGGSHASGDLLDRNLAFSEGWSTAWSGVTLGSESYTDSYGNAQAASVTMSLATPPSVQRGWFNEASVAHVLWKLNKAAGLSPIVQALRGPFRSVVASTGIHAFQASLRTVAPAASLLMAPLLESQLISSTADAWGLGETNNGGSAVALPMVHALVAGQPTTDVCVSSALDPNRVGNKLGSRAYLRFSIPAAGNYQVDLQGPAGSDPDWAITNANGIQHRSVAETPSADTATVALTAGDYLMAVNEHKPLAVPTCFTVKIQ